MAKKKIYDIKPPKIAKKTEDALKDFLHENKTVVRNSAAKNTKRPRKKSYPAWLPVSVAAGVVLVIIFGYLFFKLPKAEIVISPKVDVLSFKQSLTADKSADFADMAEGIIPAEFFEATKTVSQEFDATGNADNTGKASGSITVYNKYSPPAPFTLKVGTRFVSDSGKLFVALEKIVIPAAKKSGSKITPGSVQVKVQAAEGGESYNISPSSFSVPGLKGTAYYYSIYAESSDAMSGGFSGKTKKVTEDDILSAKDFLEKKASEEATSQLKSQIGADYILLDSAVSTSVVSASTETKVGTVANKFTYQITVKAKGLAFKKSDSEEFSKNYLISQMPEGKIILDNTFKTDYSISSIDAEKGKATVGLDFSSGIYQKIDKNALSMSLLGKNEQQITETIKNSLGENVSKIEVNFWPFWVSRSPKNQKAVSLELKFK